MTNDASLASGVGLRSTSSSPTVAAKATVTGLTPGNAKGPAAHASLKAKRHR